MRSVVSALRSRSPARVADGSTLAGAVVWILVAPVLDHAVRLFLLAPLVLVPLGLSLTATPTRRGRHATLYRAATWLQPVAALLVVVGVTRPTGTSSGVVVLPWLVTTLLVAGYGLWRLSERGLEPLPETVVDAGLLYLPVGGTWLVVDRFGFAVGAFTGPVVLFTAVHFHYAGFVVPVVAGVGGRPVAERYRRVYRWLASAVLVGPGLVAVGIAGAPTVEVLAVVGYTVAVAGLVALLALATVSAQAHPLSGVALTASALAVAAAMALAFAYGITPYVDTTIGLTADRMVALHGSLNAVFAITALGGLRLRDPDPTADCPVPGIPYSRLWSRGPVGTDFFDRRGLVDGDRSADGMVTDVAVFERAGFDPSAVSPSVRAVYERSAATDLRLTAEWRPGLRLAGRLAGRVTGVVDQLHLPAHDVRVDTLESSVVAVTEPGPGRPDARAWTRWYADSGRAMYVASYETHVHEGTRYLNVAFPLPGCNLTGVLRPENDGEGLVLSSHRNDGDDAGLYLGTPLGLFRLPLAERLRLEPTRGAAAGADRVTAVHDVTVFGVRVVTLTYEIDILEARDAEPPAGPTVGTD